MSLKIYIHLEDDAFPKQTSKIQVPKSWSEKQVKDVVGLFLTAYNKKNADFTVDVDSVHFELEDGTKIYSNDKVCDALEDHQDYHIKFGKHNREEAVTVAADSGLVRCRNYGCNQFFKEEENHDQACQHHTSPPIFHDTMKCWSCCRDRKAYDFETFQLISGCVTGRHSTQPPAVSIAASPNAVNPCDAPQPVLKSISDFNTSNPEAATAASSAAKTVARKSTRQADGTARCQRKGCQKTFNVAENGPTACKYHKGQPIFHDAIKFWSCCDNVKCYDFDEFLAVPGCATGWHDDGEIELEKLDA